MTPPLVSNIGGVFIFSENAPQLASWYEKHLGIKFASTPDGSTFYTVLEYIDIPTGKKASIAWSILGSKKRPTHVKDKLFMINYRVFDADATAAHLRSLGVEVKGVETYPEGKFAWCSDLEGNELELWEDTSLV